MLDSFWNSLDLSDVRSLEYLDDQPYPSEDKLDSVLQKLDWLILKLHPKKDSKLYDYNVVVGLKNEIQINSCSLTQRGVDFLNSITQEIKNDSF